ncbi:sugar kinase [Maledivibacter halophilus]|uniref:2-dehydro-3-deoxygluconokinase n=1 Tax=Maledivibacter halophilus TaxID=36842 RepID=A0A1T5MDJ4_9FIRM|nr:sugar kinase [Maledivibacter halophilus]SKC86297.1 2-dehydro-3-deoxygluconokinase [Maledivibacter halophilus]
MDVVTFGETMVLFNPDSNGPLRYAHRFTKSIGGAESNVAIALTRLGHEVGWFSRVGNDEFGKYIKSVIRGEGVDVSRVVEDEERNTGLIFKERFMHTDPNIYYYRKNSATSFLNVDDLDYDYIKQSKILHITGITLALSKLAREAVYKAIEIAKKEKVLISFDPNMRFKLWSKEEAKPILLDIAKKVDIILPGISEAEMLLGINNPKEISNRFLDMGCNTVAIKLGKEGCYVSDKNSGEFCDGYVIDKFEDTVGAGDGFAAGFLSGILKGLSLKESAQMANAVGAMATLVRGDMEGFPTTSQVMEFMGKEKYVDR